MEHIHDIDNDIDEILNNKIVYTIIIVLLIGLCAFPDYLSNINSKLPKSFQMNNFLPKILFLLIIIYFSNKDIRIMLLLSIMFLLLIEKMNKENFDSKIIHFIATDIKNQERIARLQEN